MHLHPWKLTAAAVLSSQIQNCAEQHRQAVCGCETTAIACADRRESAVLDYSLFPEELLGRQLHAGTSEAMDELDHQHSGQTDALHSTPPCRRAGVQCSGSGKQHAGCDMK